MNGREVMKCRKTMIPDDFETLDIQFRLNPTNSDIVDILNNLNDVERNLFIQYVKCGGRYATLSREVNISVPFIKEQIKSIRNKILERYENLTKNQ